MVGAAPTAVQPSAAKMGINHPGVLTHMTIKGAHATSSHRLLTTYPIIQSEYFIIGVTNLIHHNVSDYCSERFPLFQLRLNNKLYSFIVGREEKRAFARCVHYV